ncbi:MAG: hypothetical protein ACYTG5_07240, partial [Planctomycetota bacterium]
MIELYRGLFQDPELQAAKAEVPQAESTQSRGDQATELARKTQNPIADLISVPFQNNINFGVGPN